MPKSIISEGKTSTEAIEKGLKELKVSRNQVDIKILEEKKKSFFNILEPHVVKVELTLKEKEEKQTPVKKAKTENVSKEDLEKAKKEINTFLSEFLKQIADTITYEISEEENVVHVLITGEESTRLIGYRGESLNSLQTILTTIANKGRESNVKVILDIGEYKDARKKTLEDLASKIEKTVTKTGKAITLEPMTAYERKIIHTKLQDSKTVKTHSIGENENRRVVISRK